ncbi:hypothetical protein GDO86_015749 [Hymenochirus boettgeri]|uniref:Uncharacterized protein n=1 Tax=Hymenochirus boettgeri TaxID=247094 RepID=A0A8T2JU85_9PIPI|nr:hypothetical protein GDO86_015749 [Hymenochirus boettgeri]
MSEKYGPVFTIHISNQPAVCFVGYDCMKEAFLDHNGLFGERGHMGVSYQLFKDYGVLNSNGERWKQIRRFSINTLKNFGMGKRSIEERIQGEAQCLVKEFRKRVGTPFDPTYLLSLAVSNVICSILLGERFDYEDEEFLNLLSLLKEIFQILTSKWGLLSYGLPKTLFYLLSPLRKTFGCLDKVRAFVEESVKKHRETLDVHCPRDFIDCFLIKMDEEKNNPETEFHSDNLFSTIIDLFFAGTETTSTTLKYSLLILLDIGQPVARKAKQEIDDVIGQDRCPSSDDRIKMPYTNAIVNEIQRVADIVPIGLPNRTTHDTIFRGYNIPKGTFTFHMLTSVLKDPKYFKYPNQFNPGNFLEENGTFKKNNAFIPFSIGKKKITF